MGIERRACGFGETYPRLPGTERKAPGALRPSRRKATGRQALPVSKRLAFCQNPAGRGRCTGALLTSHLLLPRWAAPAPPSRALERKPPRRRPEPPQPAIPHVPAPETITLRTSTVRRRMTCEADRYAYAHRTAQDQSSIPIAFSCNSLHCCHIRRSRAGHDREADAGPTRSIRSPIRCSLPRTWRASSNRRPPSPAPWPSGPTSPSRRPRPRSRRWSRSRRPWAPWPSPTWPIRRS